MSSEAVYFSTRATVRFVIHPKGFTGARVLAEISKAALCEVFGARDDGDSLIATYRVHSARIQIKALSRHCADPSSPVTLERDDFEHAAPVPATPGDTGRR